MAQAKQSLSRALTLTDAVALVIGTVIGTGVFLKTALMTQQLGSPVLVLLAWLAAGLLSLAGALAYAELGAMFPDAGGEYIYIGKAFGDAPAFLYGWMQFAVAGAGAIGGLSIGFAIFLSALIPMGGVQAFGMAMMAALWAYNGWYILPIVAGEVQRPQRNVPRGLIFGMLATIVTYLVVNLAYFYALPLTEVVTANSTAHADALPVAAKAAQTFLGSTGAAFISLAFVVSTLGALNGAIMGQARIPFAMARNGLFFRRLGEVSTKGRAPVWAILAQSGWGCVLALSGTFDQITTYVMFALWLFFGVTVSAVFVLRWKMPDVERPYKTLGYPLVPMLFILVAAWLVINTIVSSPVESGVGLILIALGVPVYLYFKRARARMGTATEDCALIDQSVTFISD